MYINFWYPIAKSDEVTADVPHRVQVLGLKFVSFRDENGDAHLLSDTCVHRGGSLSKGWMKDGCVVCPYHGWEYGGDGKCITVPSIGFDAKPPARAKVDSYPIQEKYGIVFAFLGDLPEAERPPLYEIEEFGQEGWRASEPIIFDAPFYYERSMENGVDPAHNEFVHPTHGFSGTKPDYRVKDTPTYEETWGCWSEGSVESSEYKENTMKQVRDGEGITNGKGGHHGPNMLYTLLQFTEKNWFHQYLFEAPVDEGSTRIFFVNLRNCLMEPAMDDRVVERCKVIADQDIELLSELNPIRTPPNNTKEVMTPADKNIMRYRKYLKEWEQRGWRIDLASLVAKQGDVAYAIPSPERRTSGNWVMDSVPLMPSAETRKAAAE